MASSRPASGTNTPPDTIETTPEITLEETPGTTPNVTPPEGSSPSPTAPNTPMTARLSDADEAKDDQQSDVEAVTAPVIPFTLTPRKKSDPDPINSVGDDVSEVRNDGDISNANDENAEKNDGETSETSEDSVIHVLPKPNANGQLGEEESDAEEISEEENDAGMGPQSGWVSAVPKKAICETLRFVQEIIPAAGVYTIAFGNGKTCPTRYFDGQDGLIAGLTLSGAHLLYRLLQRLAFETQPTADPRMRGQGRLSLGMSLETIIAVAKLVVAGSIGLALDCGASAIDEAFLHGPNAALVIGVLSYCGGKIAGKVLDWTLSPPQSGYEELNRCPARSAAQHAGGYVVVGFESACAVMLATDLIARATGGEPFSPSADENFNTMARLLANAGLFELFERLDRFHHHEHDRCLQKPQKPVGDEELGSDVENSEDESNEYTALRTTVASPTYGQKLGTLGKEVGPALVTLLITAGLNFGVEQGADQWNDPDDIKTAGTWTGVNALTAATVYFLFDLNAVGKFGSNLVGNTKAVAGGVGNMGRKLFNFFHTNESRKLQSEGYTPRDNRTSYGIRKK